MTSRGVSDARAGGIEQAVEAVFEADDFDAGVAGGLDDGANDGVQAGCITAAGEHANLLHRRHVTHDYKGKKAIRSLPFPL